MHAHCCTVADHNLPPSLYEEKGDRPSVIVLFVSGDWAGHRLRMNPAQRHLRIIRRKPIRWARWLFSAAVRACTRSPFAHVAVASGHVGLNPCYPDAKFFPVLEALLEEPTLLCAVEIPVQRWVDFDGQMRGYPCVGAVVAVLDSVGVQVPPWIMTPKGLHSHLIRRGYRHVRFTDVEGP